MSDGPDLKDMNSWYHVERLYEKMIYGIVNKELKEVRKRNYVRVFFPVKRLRYILIFGIVDIGEWDEIERSIVVSTKRTYK